MFVGTLKMPDATSKNSTVRVITARIIKFHLLAPHKAKSNHMASAIGIALPSLLIDYDEAILYFSTYLFAFSPSLSLFHTCYSTHKPVLTRAPQSSPFYST
jgi:hypothetical protein